MLVNYIREYEIAHGVPKSDAYDVTMYVMAGLLVVGSSRTLRCARWTRSTISAERPMAETNRGERVRVALAWLYVGIPLAWGVAQTVIKSAALFR